MPKAVLGKPQTSFLLPLSLPQLLLWPPRLLALQARPQPCIISRGPQSCPAAGRGHEEHSTKAASCSASSTTRPQAPKCCLCWTRLEKEAAEQSCGVHTAPGSSAQPWRKGRSLLLVALEDLLRSCCRLRSFQDTVTTQKGSTVPQAFDHRTLLRQRGFACSCQSVHTLLRLSPAALSSSRGERL